MIEQLMSFFTGTAKETANKTPDGFCPNCWGEQEYDKEIRELQKDMQIDVNNHKANYGFIQDFVVNKIDGIQLKKGNNGMECPVCHSKAA